MDWGGGMSTEIVVRSLTECETVIERGLATFVEVGEALMEIRDEDLYKESHGTFEEYCRERWDMTRQHANRTIRAAEVIGVLEPMGSNPIAQPPPASERVARELAPLRAAPEVMREAWTEAVETYDKPTAEQVRGIVADRLDPPPIPPAIERDQERREEADALVSLIESIVRPLGRLTPDKVVARTSRRKALGRALPEVLAWLRSCEAELNKETRQ